MQTTGHEQGDREMTTEEIKAKLDSLLAIDSPSNYDSSDSACESIADEFEDLTIEQHTDVCDAIEVWFERGE
jgi:hypothetical protein